MIYYVISTINHRIQPLVRQLNAILGVKLGFKVHAGGSLSCTGEVRLLVLHISSKVLFKVQITKVRIYHAI